MSDKNKTFKIEISREVSQEEVDDLLTTALEGGITYWCDGARVKDHPLKQQEYVGYLSEALTRGFDLELHDREYETLSNDDTNGWYTLTLEAFLEAIGKSNIDFDNYDAYDADRAVQIAIFGELIYG